MFVIDATGKTEFVLLAGTEHEVRFDWPTGACPPGTWGEKVYAALAKLRTLLSHQSPQLVPLVDGILLGWVYASIEAQRLRDDNTALEARLKKVEHDLKNVMAAQVARDLLIGRNA
jgi:hypothetical protein